MDIVAGMTVLVEWPVVDDGKRVLHVCVVQWAAPEKLMVWVPDEQMSMPAKPDWVIAEVPSVDPDDD